MACATSSIPGCAREGTSKSCAAGRIRGCAHDPSLYHAETGASEDTHVTAPLLEVENLKVTFSTRRGLVEAVRGVSLSLQPGEMLGLVGESGSGKSVTGFAITHLLDKAGRITNGSIRFKGQDITRVGGA